jgi:autotransporter-associated beta strand protein
MNFGFSRKTMAQVFGAALAIYLATAASQAATWTWDYTGLPGSVWDTIGQWTDPLAAPDVTNPDPGTEDLIFGDSTNNFVSLVDANQSDRVLSITFNSDAPAYAFSRPSYPKKHVTISPGGFLTNNSGNVQSFLSGLALDQCTVNAAGGDSLTNYAFEVGDHLYLDTSSDLLTGPAYTGPFDLHVTGTGTGALTGETYGTTFTINDAKLIVEGGMNNRNTFTLNGTGQVIIKGAWSPGTGTPTKAGNGTLVLDGSSSSTRTMTINEGVVRIGNAAALGASANITTIGGGAYNGRLELYNDIATEEHLVLNARESAGGPHIVNFSGNNTLSGTIETGDGGGAADYHIESAAGLLTISGGITNVTPTGPRVLNLRGAGDGLISGAITDGAGVWSIKKWDAGTWTLSSPDNNFTGNTVVVGGVLELAETGRISVSSAITDNATFLISGGTHELGAVDGSGTMIVSGSAQVTASSIVQGALTIGSERSFIAPLSAGSATAVPEPGTWLLLAIAALTGGFAVSRRGK